MEDIREADEPHPAAHELVFSRPAQYQSASKLLRLPTELRTIILRELLYSTKPLENASAMDESDLFHASRARKRPTRRTFTFHPAILQTCQLLHSEGCSVLYQENTLCIYVGLQSIPQITILDNRIRVIMTEDCTFQDALDRIQSEESHDALVYASSIQHIPHVLRRMNMIQITIVAHKQMRLEPPDGSLHEFCSCMQTALHGKSVEVHLVQPWLPASLAAFSILRCPKFIIRSWRSKGEKSKWVVEHHDFYKTITGNEPVYDTLKVYKQLAIQIERISPEGDTCDVSDARADLYEEAFRFNQHSFIKAAERVLRPLNPFIRHSAQYNKTFVWRKQHLDKAWHILASTKHYMRTTYE